MYQHGNEKWRIKRVCHTFRIETGGFLLLCVLTRGVNHNSNQLTSILVGSVLPIVHRFSIIRNCELCSSTYRRVKSKR